MRFGNRRKRQAILFEHLGDVRGTVGGHLLAQQRHQPVARQHAGVVAVQAWVVAQRIAQFERVAEDAPGGVAHHGKKNLLAVLHLEHVIDRPGGDARRHGRRGLAGHRVLHHVLADQKGVVLEQRALHLLAKAGLLALRQGGHGTHGAEHAAHDVVDAGARPQRIAGAARHIG
ncbi:hypothetical protein SDC9_139539 [bioreactor metagenome]|uniref:Uncharacterized protein n=1 Tax=bioreactor metagenome TaxID=1076179 RepID=A0A645DSE6_9ZZZZ